MLAHTITQRCGGAEVFFFILPLSEFSEGLSCGNYTYNERKSRQESALQFAVHLPLTRIRYSPFAIRHSLFS